MPRDGSNVYSKPSGTTAVSGTTIESAKFNLVIDDLVTDANTARALSVGGTGATSASGARTNLGLGSMALQGGGGVNITGGTITGITDLAIADGGTGASSASAARTNLGLVIGTDVQAYDATLAAVAALDTSTGMVVQTGTDTFAKRTITSTDTSVTITNPGGVAGNIDLSVPVGGGMTLLGTIATTSGNTVTLGSLDLTNYKFLLFVVRSVSISGTSAQLQIGAAGVVFTPLNSVATEIFSGHLWVNLVDGYFSANVAVASSGSATGPTTPYAGFSSLTTASTSVTFDISGSNNFDAGSILVYGVK